MAPKASVNAKTVKFVRRKHGSMIIEKYPKYCISRMKKRIVELSVIMPLVTEDDLFHNEMVWYLLVMASQILCVKGKKTDEELRIIKVYSIISKIGSCYTCINQAYNFIKCRPTITELDNNEEMTVIDYYNYHYDVIIHKLSTIRDLSIKLINIVFELKLSDRNCNWDNLLKKREMISIPGVLDIQALFFYLMEEIKLDRNESSHNGAVEIRLFRDIDVLVQLSQLRRLGILPKDIIAPDPMAKGTYYNCLLMSRKKDLLRKIKNHKAMSLFCIHVLTCCISNKFKSDVSKELLDKYAESIQKANLQIESYGRKINKLAYLIPYLIDNDKTIEYLKNHGKDKNYRINVSLVNL